MNIHLIRITHKQYAYKQRTSPLSLGGVVASLSVGEAFASLALSVLTDVVNGLL